MEEPRRLSAALDSLLAPPAIARQLQPGSVVVVDDSDLYLPSDSTQKRNLHETRICVVVQAAEFNRSARPATILVAPCSASHAGPVQAYMVALPRGVADLTKDSVCYVELVQPIPKRSITRVLGTLPEPYRSSIVRTLAILVNAPIGTPNAALERRPPPKPNEPG